MADVLDCITSKYRTKYRKTNFLAIASPESSIYFYVFLYYLWLKNYIYTIISKKTYLGLNHKEYQSYKNNSGQNNMYQNSTAFLPVFCFLRVGNTDLNRYLRDLWIVRRPTFGNHTRLLPLFWKAKRLSPCKHLIKYSHVTPFFRYICVCILLQKWYKTLLLSVYHVF